MQEQNLSDAGCRRSFQQFVGDGSDVASLVFMQVIAVAASNFEVVVFLAGKHGYKSLIVDGWLSCPISVKFDSFAIDVIDLQDSEVCNAASTTFATEKFDCLQSDVTNWVYS